MVVRMRTAAAFAALAWLLAAGPVLAGEAPCRIENGAIVVAAAAGPIAGDFLLDLAAPQSQLHLTRAQMEGIDAESFVADLRLAGTRRRLRFAVADLDARERGFPITLNGVIGADALVGRIARLSFDPCRLRLDRRRAREEREAIRMPLRIVEGVPAAPASITDGRLGIAGWFALATARPDVAVSTLIGRTAGGEGGRGLRLAALGFAGEADANLAASLDPNSPPGLLGGVGLDVLSRYDLMLDLTGGELALSAPRRARSAGSSGRARRRR
jgi:hypothetical protein